MRQTIKDLKKRCRFKKNKVSVVNGKVVHKILHVIKEREEPEPVEEQDDSESQDCNDLVDHKDRDKSPIIGK